VTAATPAAVSTRSRVAGLEREPWDVAVVGAGPAGAIAARRLALAGARVLLLDRRAFPRDKACGDGLIPDAIACLRRNGLYDRVARLAHRWPGGTFHGPYRAAVDIDVELMTLRRVVLDAELAAAAVEAGATLARGLVTNVVDRGDAGAELHVSDTPAPLRARYALLTTGASVGLLDGCGLLERAAPSAVAIRTYVRSSLALDRLIVSFDRRILPGYGWIFPMGDGTFNVGCGVVVRDGGDEAHDLRGMLERFCATFEPARALVAAERSREPLRGAMLRYALRGARPYAGGALLAAGEAIGSTYPLTGEGIGKAMETAEMAADALVEALATRSREALSRYPERVTRELRAKYRGYEFGERCARRAWLAELILRQAARRVRVRETLAAILAETRDPSEVFSFGGLARALFA
jgi:menaquinone-9 beta-reductase